MGSQESCEEQFSKITHQIGTKPELEELSLNYNSFNNKNNNLTINSQILILTLNVGKLKKLKSLELNFGFGSKGS